VIAWQAAVILLGVLCAGFYAGAETGAYSVNRLRLRLRADRGDRSAKILARLLADPVGFVCMTLVGHNLAVFAVSSVVTTMMGRFVTEHYSELAATGAVALPLFALAEVTPKNLFRALPGVLMYRSAHFLLASRVLFAPVIAVLELAAWFWRRLFGDPESDAAKIASGASLEYLLAEGLPGVKVSPYQRFIATRILGLSERPVRDCMVPWRNVATVLDGASEMELMEQARATGHSRLVVVDEDGVPVGTRSIFDRCFAAEALAPPKTVNAERNVLEVLNELRRERISMALVCDDGHPVGVVTMKDLLEEIVGDLVEW